jgi:hypothetical protein
MRPRKPSKLILIMARAAAASQVRIRERVVRERAHEYP